MCAHSMRNSSQILHGNRTTLGKYLQVYHAISPAQIFVTRMLTRDVFAVANIFVLFLGLNSLPARRRPQGLVVIGVCLSVCVSVCLSVCAHCVCPQDISRTGSWITTKFGGGSRG